MTRLRDLALEISYGASHDRLHDFYVPCLGASVRYQRMTGFFSVTSLAMAAQGVAQLIRGAGRMQLLVGAQLHPDDVAAITAGADLAEVIAPRMLGSLEEVADVIARERLAALAWMVREGTLEMRVVLPRGPGGRPLPARIAEEYFHPKEGLFTDRSGDQVAFSGSVNESEAGWDLNYEQFMVFRSWDPGGRPYLEQVRFRFVRLWEGREESWIALPVPEAVREGLLRLAPERPPERDPLQRREPLPPDQRSRMVFQFLRDAPRLLDRSGVGVATSTLQPWPHQRLVMREIVERYPQRYLLADEVGLGKTIEAGLALRELVLAGSVRRCLILVPKSVLRQWQEELYEKFGLNVPAYAGGQFLDYFRRPLPASGRPWSAFPIVLASSQLAKRRDRQDEIVESGPFDLVIVDEAHHARRKDFRDPRYRPNRLLELLSKLSDATEGLLLLTATPMQIHPVEMWDLLALLGLGGAWGASEEHFLRFFRELRRAPDDISWAYVLRLVREELEVRGQVDGAVASMAAKELGPVEWSRIRDLPYAPAADVAVERLSRAGRKWLLEYARRHTPVGRLMFRSTRRLLRRYHREGLLREKVPSRKPRIVWIPMRDDERRLYRRVDEYITDFYAKYETERKGLGFVMTVYRRRLTSSFFALQRSLERRLEYLEGKAGALPLGWTDEDWEEAELERDADEELSGIDRRRFGKELEYLRDFLSELAVLGGDSKWEQFREELGEVLSRRDSVVVFTQYTDTMDYLRDRLAAVFGSRVACYSGRGGEGYQEGSWTTVTKESVKNAFRNREVTILLCTEAASEGLNLQTCGVLINYDMPWNPMRVEQRIGRIDRIGQVHDVVWVSNYFYQDTVEATVYDRLADRIDWFQDVVGELQPILAAVGRVIERTAMTRPSDREALLKEELANLRAQIDEARVDGFAIEDFALAGVEPEAETPAVTLRDIERELLGHPTLGARFASHLAVAGAYWLEQDGSRVAVTFDPQVFDAHPDTARLLTYGEPLLDGLLGAVAPPLSSRSGKVLRLETDLGIAWARGEAAGPVFVRTLDELRGALATDLLSADMLTAAEEMMRDRCRSRREELTAARRAHVRARLSAQEEKGRLVLLQAACIDALVEGADPDAKDSMLIEEALERVTRQYPLSALSALVGRDDLPQSEVGSMIERLAKDGPERWPALLAEAKTAAARLVKDIQRSRQDLQSLTASPDSSEIEVSVYPA